MRLNVPQKCQKCQICRYQIQIYSYFFYAPNAPKLVFGRGSAPDTTGELTTVPRLTSRRGGDISRRLRRFDLGATAPRLSAPPPIKFLATPI